MNGFRQHRGPSFIVMLLTLMTQLYGLPVEGQARETMGTSDVPGQPSDLVSTVNNGLLIINGQYLPAPYQIVCNDECVTVNGVAFLATCRPSFYASTLDMAVHQDDSNPETCRLIARGLSDLLMQGNTVVAFDGKPVTFTLTPSGKAELFDVLISQNRNSVATSFPVLSEGNVLHDRFLQWAKHFQPPPKLRSEMKSHVDWIQSLETASRQRTAMIQWTVKAAWPLSIVGMLLGVITFGKLLEWSGEGMTSGQNCGNQSVRSTQTCVLLIICMSLFDLIWTIFSNAAGQMAEVNPIASSLMWSPFWLTFFKFGATGVGVAILYMCRRNSTAQRAAWWMCLVLVLLTFRWVVVDSLRI